MSTINIPTMGIYNIYIITHSFTHPYGIAIDSLNNIYVSDYSANCVQKFDFSGTYITQWGTTGSGDGQFNSCALMARDSFDNIYVADHVNHRIQKFNSSGTYLAQFGTSGTDDGQFDNPMGVGVDSLGNIYISDFNLHRIQKFNSSGTFLLKWGSFGSGNGYFNSPIDIKVDISNNVYIVDMGNHRVQKFDSSGNYLSQFGSYGSGDGQFNNPNGIAIDSGGNFFVVDTVNSRIQKFNPSYVYQTQWGTSGSGSGQFAAPVSMVISNTGGIYVAEYTNVRVQYFAPDPIICDILDILVNVTDTINFIGTLDILVDVSTETPVNFTGTFDIFVDIENNVNFNKIFDLTIDMGYDSQDYQYCSYLDILVDIAPQGYFNSNFITVDPITGTPIIDPTTGEPLIETPTQPEFLSRFGCRAWFQIPDAGLAPEIDFSDILDVSIKKGINQPIYWSLKILNKDRKYSGGNNTFNYLINENLYVNQISSRRFIAIVLMAFCGDKTETLIFPRLVIKEVSGTEVLTISGHDEISEYMTRKLLYINPYCSTESLSKIIPPDQILIDPDLVVTNQYTAVALSNAFIDGKINNTNTWLLLNYNITVPFDFDFISTIFTIDKPTPIPPAFGSLPSEVPVYQIESPPSNSGIGSTTTVLTSEDLWSVNNVGIYTENTIETPSTPANNTKVASIPAVDSQGNPIYDSYGKQIMLYYIVNPKLPVIAISPLYMHWIINDMCEQSVDQQQGNVVKEHFQVNQYYKDFPIYTDINVQNSNIGGHIKTCLDAIPGEYMIVSNTDTLCPQQHNEIIMDYRLSQIGYIIKDGDIFESRNTIYTYDNSIPKGTTIILTSQVITYPQIPPITATFNLTTTTINSHFSISNDTLTAGIINSWKLSLNIYDVILETEKPKSPDWFIPEILTRTSEHIVSRTGVTKINTQKVVSPMDLGKAQVYPSIIEMPPQNNQNCRPIYNGPVESGYAVGNFIGLSCMQPVTTPINSWFYLSNSMPVCYYPVTLLNGNTVINFGGVNQLVIDYAHSSPSSVTIISGNSTYTLFILWDKPVTNT